MAVKICPERQTVKKERYIKRDYLPKKLTISFPLCPIYGTKGEYSPYYDIEKVIIEHKERGFNCIRIDSGAGLVRDLDGNLLGAWVNSDRRRLSSDGT